MVMNTQKINQTIILKIFSLWTIASKWSCVMFLAGLPSTIASIFDFLWKYSMSFLAFISRSCLDVIR